MMHGIRKSQNHYEKTKEVTDTFKYSREILNRKRLPIRSYWQSPLDFRTQYVNIKYSKQLQLKKYAVLERGITIMCYEGEKAGCKVRLSTDSRERDRLRPEGPLIYLHKEFALSSVLHIVTVWGLSGNVCSGREKQLENFQSHGLVSLSC